MKQFLFSVLLLSLIACQNKSAMTSTSVESTLRIAMAQIFCLDGDKSGNFARIENAVKEAVAANVQLICFPEMALLGWVNPDAHERAGPIPGPDTDRLAALAKEYQIYISIGLAEKVEDALYDAAVLINDTGEIILKHRKINILTDLMDPPYTPGKGVQAVQTPYGKIGMMICADSFDETVKTDMKALQPDLLIIPYGWAKEEEDWPEHGLALEKTITSAAKEIGCPVIGTDLVGAISHGPWTGLVYGGLSIASDTTGTILAKGKDRDRDLIIFDLPL